MNDDEHIEKLIETARTQTKSDDPIVKILWLIQGLDLGNYDLEQTWRYVANSIKQLLATQSIKDRKDELGKACEYWEKNPTKPATYLIDRGAELDKQQRSE